MNLGKEDERQEFIRKPGQLNKGLRSLTAMLNRQTEGTVYLGVKKDGTVKGLKTGKKLLSAIRARAAELIEPAVTLRIEERKDEKGRSFLRIDAEGSDIPYACDGRYYIRKASSDERMDRELLRKMLLSGSSDWPERMEAADSLTDNQQAVLRYLAEHPRASLQEAADGCALSLGGVKKIVLKLQDMKLLERQGPRNKSEWVAH